MNFTAFHAFVATDETPDLWGGRGSPQWTVPKIVPMLARLGANQGESGFRKLLVKLIVDLVE